MGLDEICAQERLSEPEFFAVSLERIYVLHRQIGSIAKSLRDLQLLAPEIHPA
jgi:hypothetical protein